MSTNEIFDLYFSIKSEKGFATIEFISSKVLDYCEFYAVAFLLHNEKMLFTESDVNDWNGKKPNVYNLTIDDIKSYRI
jgi:hypothetical protein